MNNTLFSEIQRLFERTYATVGINLEECLIDRARCSQLTKLAGASARELSELARTFLRTSDNRLLFRSITLNGQTAAINRYDNPTNRNWWGVTVNYQIDGNVNKDAYTVYVDKVSFTYQ